jgi:hypothetical protein
MNSFWHLHTDVRSSSCTVSVIYVLFLKMNSNMLETLRVKFSENPFRDSEFVTYRQTYRNDMLSRLFMMHLKQVHFLKIKVFHAVTPCRLVNIYGRFGWSSELNTLQQRCEEPESRKYATFPKKHSWPLKMGPIGCPETSVRNYHYALYNSPEEGNFLKFNLVWSCFMVGIFAPVPTMKA